MPAFVPEVRLRSFLNLLSWRIDLVDDAVVGHGPIRDVTSTPVVTHDVLHLVPGKVIRGNAVVVLILQVQLDVVHIELFC